MDIYPLIVVAHIMRWDSDGFTSLNLVIQNIVILEYYQWIESENERKIISMFLFAKEIKCNTQYNTTNIEKNRQLMWSTDIRNRKK